MIENIEKLKKRLKLYTLGNGESLSNSHVEIDESRTCKKVAACCVVNGVKGSISIRILKCERLTAVVKTALCSKYTANLKLPWQLYQPVKLKRMIDGKIRRPLIQVGAVDERTGLRNKPSVRTNE
jgi:hypothetical protein